MRRTRTRKTLLPGRVRIAALVLLIWGQTTWGQTPSGVTPLLTGAFGFTSQEIASLSRGQVIVKSLEPGDDKELAVAAAIRLDVPASYFVARMRQTRDFKKSDAVIDLGVFGTPPAESDLARLTLDPGDLTDLSRCRVGRCDVKLDAIAIRKFAGDINWRATDAHANATALARRTLFRYVTEYQQRGLAALPDYNDREPPVSLATGARTLLARNTWLAERYPDLHAYLDAYPAVRSPRAHDIFYWSKERFGLKPIVALTHMTIWSAGDHGETVATSRQIYASHYASGSLGISVIVPDRSGPKEGVFVVYVNRSLADVMGGWFGGVKRTVARSRARGTVSDQLRQMRVRLEAEYRPVSW